MELQALEKLRQPNAWQSHMASHSSRSHALSNYLAVFGCSNSQDGIGDLGLVADEVEAKLARIFHLAEQWDCLLLLDEADIFLAERTRTDIKRNSLVSVFLRVLEYYTGILFLTTNKVGAFDPAFKSRIHMHLYYPPLGEKQTLSIWKMNLERTLERKKTLIVDEKEIMDYALSHFHKTSPLKANWNGRQIRNAFQTATALAEYDSAVGSQPRLSQKYFDIVAKASLDFDQYIETTHDANDADRAFQNMDRNDEFKPPTDSRRHDPFRPLDPRFPPPPQYPSGPSSLGSYSPQWQPDPSAATRSPQRYAPPTMATMPPGRAYGPSAHLGTEAAYVHTPLAAASAMPAVHPQSVNEAVLYREEAGGAHPGGGWQRPQASYNEPGLLGGVGSGVSEDEGYE